MPSDLRSRAIVLRRTNYGESDRILNMLTPEGKIAVLARGVRKEKSRLAGSIELFSVADIVVHQGRSNLATLTSAKMLRFYSNILSDLSRLELAGSFLKRLDRAAEQVNIPEHYSLLVQSLAGLNSGLAIPVVSTWFDLNLARISGETINFLCDSSGEELSAELSYSWDYLESALRPDPSGHISAREIKLARFLLANKLSWTSKIDHLEDYLPPITQIAESFRNA